MKILHLCNDFAGSAVHSELYSRLEQFGVDQVVYCPIRNAKLEGNNFFEGKNTEIIYSNLIKLHHRLCFHLKINDIVKDVEKRVNLSEVNCIHATTLFSDGAVALKLKQKYGIPFIVAVRNTDVNVFMRFTPHLWNVHREVIQAAEKVIFISPNLQHRVANHWTLSKQVDLLAQKGVVIPNGLNDFWLQNIDTHHTAADPYSIVYVGKFDTNKNVLRLMHAVFRLRSSIPNIHLSLVGGGGEQEHTVKQLVEHFPALFSYHGKITDKVLLRNMYRKNRVFAMPSKKETFGLVYLEAMSQGLHVLYTRGEGIDGMFDKKVGEAVNALSEEEICEGLEKMLLHPEEYENLQPVDFEDFDWKKIAQLYHRIYTALICN